MKAKFILKPCKEDLLGVKEFVVEKEIYLPTKVFQEYEDNPIQDFDFIEENIKFMYKDDKNIMHCLFITTENIDYGYLIQSEGYKYGRHVAYLQK